MFADDKSTVENLRDRITVIGFRCIAFGSLHHIHRLPLVTFVDLRHINSVAR